MTWGLLKGNRPNEKHMETCTFGGHSKPLKGKKPCFWNCVLSVRHSSCILFLSVRGNKLQKPDMHQK